MLNYPVAKIGAVQIPIRTRLLRITAALAIIGAITALTVSLRQLNQTTMTLIYLIGVLGIAAKWGLLEAVLASAATIACKAYFFLPPLYDFRIEDPQNWVAVAAFFVVSVVASELSTRAWQKAREALARQRELEQLYAWSQQMMAAELESHRHERILALTMKVFAVAGAAIHDSFSRSTYRIGERGDEIPESKLVEVSKTGEVQELPGDVAILPLQTGSTSYGSFGFVVPALSRTALKSLSHLAAVALEHARQQDIATRAEVTRQGQQLKSLLLDSVAHEFKTPLTSIKFGATTLGSDAGLKHSQRELLEVIEEEADRMNGMISEAIEVSRLEAGNLQLERSPRSVRELVTLGAARRDRLLADRAMEIDLPDNLPLVEADEVLLSIAIAHLLDNAAKYSPESSAIRVCARHNQAGLTVSITDRGSGLSMEEQGRVFERFYRGAGASGVQGSGMGLSIVQEIVRMHGGSVHADNAPGGGACFSFFLPASKDASA